MKSGSWHELYHSRRRSEHRSRCSYPVKSWFPRDLTQLFPTNVRDTLPVSDRLQNVRLCLFSLRYGAMHSSQNQFRSFLFAGKHVAGRGAGKDHALLAICCQCHGGIIPHHISCRQGRRSSGPADELERRKIPIALKGANNLERRRWGAKRKLEDRAPIVRAARRGRAVEISIATLHERGKWSSPLSRRTA